MEKQLPKNWVETELGEITTKPQYGWTSKAGNEGEIKYLRTTDLSKGKVNWETVPYCIEIPDDISKYQVEKNDILISRAGSVGFSHRIENAPERAVFASYLIRFKPLLVNPKLIEFYLNSAEYWNSISDVSAGIAVQNINAPKLSGLKFPLPPLAEQNRIVEKLDALFAQLETIKTSMAKVPLLLKDFRQQVLTQAVTGKLKPYEKFEVVKLNDLGIWKGGGTPSKANSSFWENGTILWTTAKDMKDLFLSDSMDKITESAIKGSSAILIPKNSILIVTRSGILRRILPISSNTVETTVNQDLKVLIPNNKANYKFLLYALRGLEQDIRTTCMKSGTTVESVEFPLLKNYKINLPSIEEQQEIVSRVESLFAKADAIEKQYESLKAKIDSLPQAILHKAFKGELTQQLDSDGDARELLKEIEGLKAVNGKLSKKQKVKV